MKNPFSRLDKRTNESGFALIIVLSAIVLLLALVVGFFSRVQTDLQSSSAFQSAGSARNLADLSVNMVESQIKAGTSGKDSQGATLGWASQPGAIRTFDTSGSLVKVYKLYSSNFNFGAKKMVDDKVDLVAELASIKDWSTNRAFFTDLNEPINGQYPILDPSGAGIVKGFDITGAPLESASGNKAPMPGAWLYILKDGTVVTPTGVKDVATVSGANPSNPIVGRIAFWTDDETSKININTAGGGPWIEPKIPTVDYAYGTGGASDKNSYPSNTGFSAFWAMPISASSAQECAMAQNQPVLREYQRYPGHPANTYLTAVFPEITNMDELFGTSNTPGIIPRLQNEGSKGGSVNTQTKVILDANRLYTSSDETIFQPSRSVNLNMTGSMASRSSFFLTASSRAPDVNLFNEPRISIWPITKTTQTADPATDISKMTAFDKLIAFCETVNSVKYYFCRLDPNSEKTDLTVGNNKNLLSYLRAKVSQPVPGFGGSGILSKYPSDTAQITTEIFDYIRSTNLRDTSMVTNPVYKYAYTSKSASTSPTGAVVPIYDSSTDTRGLGRFPTLTKVGIMFFGVAINRPGDPFKMSGTSKVYVEDRYAAGFQIGAPKSDGTDDTSPTAIPADGFLRMRAMLVFELFNPGAGYGLSFPRFSMEVTTTSGFAWSGGVQMFPTNVGKFTYTKDLDVKRGSWTAGWGGRMGCVDVAGPFLGKANIKIMQPTGTPRINQAGEFQYQAAKSYLIALNYPFVGGLGYESPDVPIDGTFPFNGGKLNVVIKDENGNVVQTFTNIELPGYGAMPVPDIPPYDNGDDKLDLRVSELRMRFDNDAIFSEADTVRSVSVQPADFRMVAAMHEVPGSLFKANATRYRSSRRLAHNFFHSYSMGHLGAALGSYGGPTVKSAVTTATPDVLITEKAEADAYTALRNGYWKTKTTVAEASWAQTASYNARTYLAETESLDGAKIDGVDLLGDWDNASGRIGDGPYDNFADEGNIPPSGTAISVPYFRTIGTVGDDTAYPTYFTPNRVMPSAVMLGSLPTGVKSGKAWQTLLFRPSKTGHPGLQTPPDYLLLDLFSMPVIEPYAISEPLSTAGRINMNYQILPYTYITRSTGVQAVLRSEQMLVLDNATDAHYFKLQNIEKQKSRWKLDLSDDKGTLKGFKTRFDSGDIFRSASEICSIWLVPDTADGAPGSPSYDTMKTWWDDYIPTADNTKESSYARIYPRLTTKSNTFTVHYRVQMLKKPRNAGNSTTWTEGVDKIGAEYRGSTTIERYIDPDDKRIPDYTDPGVTNPAPLDDFYKFRVLAQKQFNP